jgi:hypothetical protein
MAGTGKAARNWEAFDAIVRALRELENDETLLVQSGKPVGRLQDHTRMPRACSSPTPTWSPHWATQEVFDELERQGPDHVRPDDRRLVDLHRHPGHPPGHVRDPGRSPASTSAAR